MSDFLIYEICRAGEQFSSRLRHQIHSAITGAGPSPFCRASFHEPNQKGRLQSRATRPIVTRIADRLGYPEQSPVSSSTCRRAAPGWQGKQQSDFAGEPLVAPIKMRLTPELANYIFDNARAESAVRGPGDGRPARFNPAQTEPPACGTRPGDVNATIAADREPYFAALVASSCKEIVIA